MTSQVENSRQTYRRTYDNFMTNRKIFLGNLAPGFFHCASVYVVIGCDTVSVSSQLDKYNDEMQLVALLVLMPLNSGMPEVPQDLYVLLST